MVAISVPIGLGKSPRITARVVLTRQNIDPGWTLTWKTKWTRYVCPNCTWVENLLGYGVAEYRWTKQVVDAELAWPRIWWVRCKDLVLSGPSCVCQPSRICWLRCTMTWTELGLEFADWGVCWDWWLRCTMAPGVYRGPRGRGEGQGQGHMLELSFYLWHVIHSSKPKHSETVVRLVVSTCLWV